jgi:hypothetical protein
MCRNRQKRLADSRFQRAQCPFLNQCQACRDLFQAPRLRAATVGFTKADAFLSSNANDLFRNSGGFGGYKDAMLKHSRTRAAGASRHASGENASAGEIHSDPKSSWLLLLEGHTGFDRWR